MHYLIVALLLWLHPFFVSVIDMKHNEKDKSIEVSLRIFTDDLEGALKKNYNLITDLGKDVNNNLVNNAVAKYIQSKLQITVDGKAKTMKYIGYEIIKESAWVYVEFDDVNLVKKIDMSCSLLYDCQDKQSNIFNIKANGTEKNYKLDYPKTTVALVW